MRIRLAVRCLVMFWLTLLNWFMVHIFRMYGIVRRITRMWLVSLLRSLKLERAPRWFSCRITKSILSLIPGYRGTVRLMMVGLMLMLLPVRLLTQVPISVRFCLWRWLIRRMWLELYRFPWSGLLRWNVVDRNFEWETFLSLIGLVASRFFENLLPVGVLPPHPRWFAQRRCCGSVCRTALSNLLH